MKTAFARLPRQLLVGAILAMELVTGLKVALLFVITDVQRQAESINLNWNFPPKSGRKNRWNDLMAR